MQKKKSTRPNLDRDLVNTLQSYKLRRRRFCKHCGALGCDVCFYVLNCCQSVGISVLAVRALAKDELLNFTRGRFRQWPEHYMSGTFVMGKIIPTEVDYFPFYRPC